MLILILGVLVVKKLQSTIAMRGDNSGRTEGAGGGARSRQRQIDI